MNNLNKYELNTNFHYVINKLKGTLRYNIQYNSQPHINRMVIFNEFNQILCNVH